jgi:hypothetical protein
MEVATISTIYMGGRKPMYPRMGGSYDKLKANLKATAMIHADDR